jgi:putative transposase
MRVDKGLEIISRDLDLGAFRNEVTLDFSRPGKPADNAFIVSFDGKCWAECLNVHWFMSLDDAPIKLENWYQDYNEIRPHGAIGDNLPISLYKSSVDTHAP